MVARHGHDGSPSEEGGNGAPMAKRDLGSSPGGLHGKEWLRRARTTA
jgi:hypothetical protein